MGILISSHNLAELESFCNKVCIIKNGVIVETSDLETVKKEASEGNYIIEVDNAKQARMVIGDMANAEDNNHIQIHADSRKYPIHCKKISITRYKDIFYKRGCYELGGCIL